MDAVFIKLLNMSISTSWLILAVVIIRVFLKKAPKWSVCILWGFVALKLIVPFSFKSIFSLIPSDEVIPETIATETHPHINSGIIYVDTAVNPVMETHLAPQVGDSANPMQVVVFIASLVWCIGMIMCLLYAMTSFIILKRRVRASKKISDNVYACDEVRSPFILGIFRPAIYIPSGMSECTLDYVIDHENAHLKRGDHFWKPLGFLLLSVYWFNPLCWVAYILLCRDIEFACDEKVIRDKDNTYVNSYSQALLDCNTHRRIIAACPLAFGETGVKDRIKGVLNYKKPAFWVIIVAIIVCIVVAVCFMTSPKSRNYDVTVRIPAGSEIDTIWYSDEEISPKGNILKLDTGDFYRGTLILLTTDGKNDIVEQTAQLQSNTPVTFQVQPGVWYRVGLRMGLNIGDNDISLKVRVRNAEVRIASENNGAELAARADALEAALNALEEQMNVEKMAVGEQQRLVENLQTASIVSGVHLMNRDEDSVGSNTDEQFDVLSATALPGYKNSDYFISSCELSATQITYVVSFDTPVYGDRIVEIYFRKADGELITLQQLAGNWTEIKFLSEGDPAQNTYRYTQSLADSINPLSVSGVVMNGVEYSFMNDDYYTGVDIPDTLRPFLSPFAERNDTFYVYAYDACEKMGAVIENDGRSYKICYRGNTLELSINDPTVYLNRNEKQMDSPAILEEGELLIPKIYMDCLGARIMMYYPERGPVHPPKEWLITP